MKPIVEIWRPDWKCTIEEKDMIEIAKCKSCGSDRYVIQELYNRFSQKLYVVECDECQREIIPVVVYHGMPREEVHDKCKEAWNKANTPE